MAKVTNILIEHVQPAPTHSHASFVFDRQVVEEGWLVRWRKFVLGRGARRYHAPGEMDNRSLLRANNENARKVFKNERIPRRCVRVTYLCSDVYLHAVHTHTYMYPPENNVVVHSSAPTPFPPPHRMTCVWDSRLLYTLLLW